MQITNWKFWGVIICSFLLGWGLSYFTYSNQLPSGVTQNPTENVKPTNGLNQKFADKEDVYSVSDLPPYAAEVLEYILEYDEAPSGYVGGRTFHNREGLLPKTNERGMKYQYREWDVKPKNRNENRGAERLVTSNEKDVYYTNDHYQSFKKIKY